MIDFSINEMLTMQKELQEKYRNKWEAITPETGKHKLLWMIGEIGEVIDIVKKNNLYIVFLPICRKTGYCGMFMYRRISRSGVRHCTLKTEQPPPGVIQGLRTVQRRQERTHR